MEFYNPVKLIFGSRVRKRVAEYFVGVLIIGCCPGRTLHANANHIICQTLDVPDFILRDLNRARVAFEIHRIDGARGSHVRVVG